MSRIVIVFMSVVFLFISCASFKEEDKDFSMFTESQLIQLAQQATNRKQWDKAAFFYKKVLKIPSSKYVPVVKYELAFLIYKKRKYAQAAQMFKNLLKEYKEHSEYPQWVKILSVKLLKKIETEKLAKKKQKTF